MKARIFALALGFVICSGFVHHKLVAQKNPVSFPNTKSTLFQGTDDIVAFGSHALAPDLSTTEFTVSLWFKTSSLATEQYVASKADIAAPGGGDIGWVLSVNTNGSVAGYFGSVSQTTQGSASAVSTGTWYHFAFTVRDIGGTMTGNIWLGGVKQGSDVTSPGTDGGGSAGARLGGGYAFAGDDPDVARAFTGNIDEVCFFSVGLTQAEVQALAAGNKPTNCALHSQAANLTLQYRMGDGDTFPTVTDQQLTTDDGTCTNMVDAATNFVSNVP